MNADGLYTVYDFVNNEVVEKDMTFGWKAEIKPGLISSRLVLRYTMLNMDWKSFDFIGDDLWNMFLKSDSYAAFKRQLDADSAKFPRTYFEADSILELSADTAERGLKIDVSKIVESLVRKKSEKMKSIKERII